MRFKSRYCYLTSALILGTTLILGGYLYYHSAISRKNSDNSEVVKLAISPGQGVSEIAETLYAERLITSPFFFKVYVKLGNLAAKLQAGEYAIPQSLSIKEVAAVLRKGVFERHLTFIEGWRREEMAAYLAEELGEKFAEDFLVASEGKEGYLFPDTYFVAPDIEALTLVKKMEDNFEAKLDSVSGARNISKADLNERIILASIVEREARFSEDRPVVAGILWKRYQNGWPLEADATVQYAVAKIKNENLKVKNLDKDFGWWPKEISKEDLEIDSPYNTRKYAGLPPTPICNPGLDSLEAAIAPRETSYWFYVSDSEGHMHYAETIEEHHENIARVMK